MQGPGHVFVVHGSLTDLVCDLALIPTSRGMHVERYWERYCPGQPGGPTEAEVAASRAALRRDERVGVLVPASASRPAFLYVDVGRNRGVPLEGDRKTRELRWLDGSVRTALARVRDEVRDGRVTATRERPLVALPAFGTGQGGFEEVRGDVARALLQRCEEAVRDGGFDVVVVCKHRADFAFLQSVRRSVGTAVLSPTRLEEAQQTGGYAARGQLSLFLGAGVSMAAGEPGFAALLRKVGAALGEPVRAQDAGQAAAEAERLRRTVGRDRFDAAVESALEERGGSLLHGLLASLRSPAVMTTNFDRLFERSAEVVLGKDELDVLPWDRKRRSPWLLKLHGSVGRSGGFVITTGDLDSFNDANTSLSAVVRAQLLLNEVLFVGYSLQDPNVHQLAADVRALLEQQGLDAQTVGTVLAIEPLQDKAAALASALDVVDLSDGGALGHAEAARLLEVFCDVVLWHATHTEPAWQLDERYAVVGDDEVLRAKLRDLVVPATPTWRALREVLRSYGLGP